MTYKKSEVFGTSLGGCCSLSLNILLGIYVMGMLVGFFLFPDYDQNSKQYYHQFDEIITYELTSSDLVPVVAIYGGGTDLFEVDFRHYSLDKDVPTLTYQVGMIGCDEYISKYMTDLDSIQIKSFRAELSNTPDFFQCPDIGSFEIAGDHSGSTATVSIRLTDEAAAQYAAGTKEERLALAEKVNNSTALIYYIVEYFSPEKMNEYGSNLFYTSLKNFYSLDLLVTRWDRVPVVQYECSYYDSLWLDLSQFQYFYPGIDCTHYFTKDPTFTNDLWTNTEGKLDLITSQIYQDRFYQSDQWNRSSLDMLLGLIGGFTGLIWAITEYMIGGYENFRFSQEIISEIYSTTTNARMRQDNEPENLQDALNDIQACLESQSRYAYSYCEYLGS